MSNTIQLVITAKEENGKIKLEVEQQQGELTLLQISGMLLHASESVASTVALISADK